AGGFPPTEESRSVRVRPWEVATGRERLRIDFLPTPSALPGRPVRASPAEMFQPPALVFSPDGARLAVSDGNTVVLWDTASGRDLQHFRGPQVNARTVAFSPDGKLLASGSADTTVLLWDVGQLVR